ncbi:MAG: GC-type dockerin domain-anchored protein [Planctomycetota bacterium]
MRDSILQHGGVGEVGGPGVLDVAGSIVEGGFIAAAGLPANIDVDPMFVDAAAGDFTPLPGSPAVDASASPPLADALGSISSMSRDAAGLPRSVDDPAAPNASNASFIDIGAVERQPCAPDINRDGVLDIDDFSAFVNAFFASDLVADVNRDNSLDIDDFSSFVSSFFAGC